MWRWDKCRIRRIKNQSNRQKLRPVALVFFIFLSELEIASREELLPVYPKEEDTSIWKNADWDKRKGLRKNERAPPVAKTHLLMPNGMQQVG
ncbi:MAG: hypothetical protein ACLVJR_01845 [Negativibacillus sp.]|jgi:hypothetical protein|nr:hypothetical protein [Clostridium sp.]